MRNFIFALLPWLSVLAAAVAQQTPEPVFSAAQSVCKISARSGRGASLGSGVLLENGYVLTVAHVVGQGRPVTCTFYHCPGAPRVEGVFVLRGSYDLAAVDLFDLPDTLVGAPICDHNPAIGEAVYHLGYPGMRRQALSKPGKVTGYRGDGSGTMDWISHFATYDSATPGDSGGAVFAADGSVIGPTSGSDWPTRKKNTSSVSTGRTIKFLREVIEKCGPAG